jgi:hypothetical protein
MGEGGDDLVKSSLGFITKPEFPLKSQMCPENLGKAIEIKP